MNNLRKQEYFGGKWTLFLCFGVFVFIPFLGGKVLALESKSKSAESLPRDGLLRLYHSHLDEMLEVRYESNGVLQEEGLRRINRFMRSRDSGKKIGMNLEIIRILDHIQDHFKVDTVEIISGFRSKEFNRYLKNNGRGVAENSFHTLGMAADIHIDEIVEKKVHRYARKLGLGGAGYYPDNLMVHVDVGVVRSWQQGQFTDRRNIGIFNKELDLEAKTDHLFYFPGNKQTLILMNPSAIPLKPQMELEWFFRGKWRKRNKLNFKDSTFVKKGGSPYKMILPFQALKNDVKEPVPEVKEGENVALPYGKFRWKIKTKDGRVQYSNEFYLKRR